jgi:hypothetical protein
VSGEDVGLHWGAVLPGVVLLLLILGSPVFADGKQAQELENLGMGDVYTDGGYLVYSDPQNGVYYFPSDEDLELEDSDTVNTVWSERKLYMSYNVYYL